MALLSLSRFQLLEHSQFARGLTLAPQLIPGPLQQRESPPTVEDSLGSEANEQLAARLGMTESALKSALFRLRGRYREILRQEVAHTVHDPADEDDEIRYLLKIVGE